ncbi:MAG: hypothetical protein PVG00_07425 [Desulfobacterales bacterium]
MRYSHSCNLFISANREEMYMLTLLPQKYFGSGAVARFLILILMPEPARSSGPGLDIESNLYGKIRSRFSYRVIVTIAVGLWTLAFTIISQAPGSRIIAVAVALFGVSQGLIMPTVMVWVGAVVPPSFRGRFSSYLGTFGFIGQFLSPISAWVRPAARRAMH